jgi:hypothetical protein
MLDGKTRARFGRTASDDFGMQWFVFPKTPPAALLLQDFVGFAKEAFQGPAGGKFLGDRCWANQLGGPREDHWRWPALSAL